MLGMGDFIFYSVLVGRAAMYDMLTAFAAYLASWAPRPATMLHHLDRLVQKHLHVLRAGAEVTVSVLERSQTYR